jgi:hypothetical protein
MTKAVATSTDAAAAPASEPAKPEIVKSEIGKPEIALAGPDQAEEAAQVATEARPEEAPAARRSAAE